MKISLANEQLELLPEKAFLWPKEGLLGLSDVHLGKAESYQNAGVPIPSGAHRDDLMKISHLIERHQVRQVAVLGDWLHDRHSVSELVAKDLSDFFRFHHNIHWVLILGNHERGSAEILNHMPFHYVKEDWQMGPFLLTHGHKSKDATHFQIQGHTHPLIQIKEGPLRLKLPCFHLEKNCLTIPAFGSLTGGYVIRPAKQDRVFAIADQDIFEVNSVRS